MESNLAMAAVVDSRRLSAGEWKVERTKSGKNTNALKKSMRGKRTVTLAIAHKLSARQFIVQKK